MRHPYDVVASGKHRAATTATWPGFTTEQHALLWCTAVQQWQSNDRRGYETLCLRWEQLLLQPRTARSALNRFHGISLPAFDRYDRTRGYIERLRRQVSPVAGLIRSEHRRYLTGTDIYINRTVAGEDAARIGYELT